MKLTIAVLTIAASAFGQDATPGTPNPPFALSGPPSDIIGAHVNWNQYASPQVGGGLFYAHKVAGTEIPTYSFTAVDFVSASKTPFRVSTVTETGVAQYVKSIGQFHCYALAMGGVSVTATSTGTSIGGAFSGGGMAITSIGRGWTAGPYFRVIKPAETDKQVVVGLVLARGK